MKQLNMEPVLIKNNEIDTIFKYIFMCLNIMSPSIGVNRIKNTIYQTMRKRDILLPLFI